MLELPLPFSLDVWYQKAASGYAMKGAGWANVIAMKQQALCTAYCSLKEKKTAAVSYSSSLFLSCAFVFFYLHPAMHYLCQSGESVQFLSDRTPTKQRNSSGWSFWSTFKNAVLGSCLDRCFFPIELRHDSIVKGEGGENHGRQWGVSLTVRKTDRQGVGRKEGGLGRLSPPPSCGLAVILSLKSEPT